MHVIINGVTYPNTDEFSIKTKDKVDQFEMESGGMQEIVKACDIVAGVTLGYQFSPAMLKQFHTHKRTRPLTVSVPYPDPEVYTERQMYIDNNSVSEKYIKASEHNIPGGLWDVSFTLTAYDPD